MRRGFMTFDEETGTLRYIPSWPPRPSVGDHWVKEAERFNKRLERKVVAEKGAKVSYEDQNGDLKVCSKDAFQRWCDDCRAEPKRLAGWRIKKKDGKTVVEYIQKKRRRATKKRTKKVVKKSGLPKKKKV